MLMELQRSWFTGYFTWTGTITTKPSQALGIGIGTTLVVLLHLLLHDNESKSAKISQVDRQPVTANMLKPYHAQNSGGGVHEQVVSPLTRS